MRDRKTSTSHPQLCGYLGCTAPELQPRPSAGGTNHLYLKPIHAPADAGAERFCTRLLGRKPRRKTLCRLAFAKAILLLSLGVNAVQETLPKAIQRLLDASNLNQIDPC